MRRDAVVKPARERIIDAAETVMREKGLARATTRAIATAAGYSEAMLYKHFADKQEIFLAVLQDRLRLTPAPGDEARALAARLEHVVTEFLDGFTRTFPMAASIFSAPDLLAEHRRGVAAHGGGPAGAVDLVQHLLDAGRMDAGIPADADTTAAARALVGTAFHQAFLTAYSGDDEVPGARDIARAAVGLALRGLGATTHG